MKSPFKPFLICYFITFTISEPILPTSIESNILQELEEELDAEIVADNNSKTDEKPKIDYSKYNIPGLTDDGYFNGQKVVSITEIGDNQTLKSATPLETVTPVESVQEISKITPLKNAQEIVSMEEVLKMTPISDEVALKFLKQMDLKSGSDPETKSSLQPAPTVESKQDTKPSPKTTLESGSKPEPKQSPEDVLTLDSGSLPITDLGDYQRILKLLGIKSFAKIKKITPVDSPDPSAIRRSISGKANTAISPDMPTKPTTIITSTMPTITTTGTSTTSTSPLTVAVSKMEYGEFCSGVWTRITNIQTCMAAADILDLHWGAIFDGPGDFPGCLYANDGRNKVFFNTSPNSSSDPSVRPNYAEICTKAGLLAAELRKIEEEIEKSKGYVKILESGIKKEEEITNYLDGERNKLIQKLNKLVEIKNKHEQKRNEEAEKREAVKKVIEAKEIEKVKKIEQVKNIQEVTNKAPVESIDEEANNQDYCLLFFCP